MKKLRLSLQRTIQALSDKVFDYPFFLQMAIAGFIADGYAYLEVDNGREWVSMLDREQKRWYSINVRAAFYKLKDVKA